MIPLDRLLGGKPLDALDMPRSHPGPLAKHTKSLAPLGIGNLVAYLSDDDAQPFLVVWKNIPYRRANSVPGCECSKLTLGHLP
ncbi:hypothetical protein, partial [Maribrevibacterium harenarium]|uniref:hypothetical protein n=1 Tax=Maribrevibacterium harenarium TaxID=2589817 RepID=UPI001C613013